MGCCFKTEMAKRKKVIKILQEILNFGHLKCNPIAVLQKSEGDLFFVFRMVARFQRALE